MRKILLIEDHEVVRDGIKRIFAEQPGDFEFGEADTPPIAIRKVTEVNWDIVILDLSLGERSGLEVLKQVKRIRPKLPVLILSMHSEQQYARRAFKAGASGYLTKECSRGELVTAVRKLLSGGRYVSPVLAESLVVDLGKATNRPPHEQLSDREFEVMRLIASGKTVGQIAELLALSDKTISTYRARILQKMGMKTNAEITHYAIQNKLAE